MVSLHQGHLLRLGWESFTFELAGIVLRDQATKEVIAILALRVDDVKGMPKGMPVYAGEDAEGS